jgi:geranylgeranyl pyrophosphate synthase
VNERLATINFLNPVQELILEAEERMRSQSEGHSSELAAALNHLLASGGKRVRTALTLLSGEMLGGDRERTVTLAAAVELLHTATLVHDDLIDGSLLRRGNPTLNSHWSPAATVLTGDFIFAKAAKLAAETDSVDVMRLFAETLAIIVNGEILQLFDQRKKANRDDYFQRIHAKTASMFELATRAAAMLSPVSEETVQALGEYGYHTGMAFQIIDDVLDFTGEQISVGKPVANDLRQGIITLPVLYYLEMNPDDPELKAFFNGRNPDEERVMKLVGSIRRSGAIQHSLDEAQNFISQALVSLEKMPDNPEREALRELALYIVERRH